VKTIKLTILSSVNESNLENYKELNKFEIDLREHISSPIDNIIRVKKGYHIRNIICDVFLIITEQLELKFFTIEFGIVNYQSEE